MCKKLAKPLILRIDVSIDKLDALSRHQQLSTLWLAKYISAIAELDKIYRRSTIPKISGEVFPPWRVGQKSGIYESAPATSTSPRATQHEAAM